MYRVLTVEIGCRGWGTRNVKTPDGVARSGAARQSGRRAIGPMWWKWPLDLLVGAPLVVALLPAMLILSVMVKLESPGPLFYRQERAGLDGRRFWIFKFRTTQMNNDENAHREAAARWFAGHPNGTGYKSLDDPRITRVGRFLRRFSLDELPQLLN